MCRGHFLTLIYHVVALYMYKAEKLKNDIATENNAKAKQYQYEHYLRYQETIKSGRHKMSYSTKTINVTSIKVYIFLKLRKRRI